MSAKKPPLPDDFAETLRAMHTAKDLRLTATIRAARAAGWSAVALGVALGCSHQNVHQMAARTPKHPGFRLPTIPPPPPNPPPSPKPDRRMRKEHKLTPDQIAELRALYAVGPVRSGTPADSPKRRAGERLAALLAEHRAAGVTVSELAREMGVLRGSIQGRLARHGYQEAPPSMAAKLYRGCNRWEAAS